MFHLPTELWQHIFMEAHSSGARCWAQEPPSAFDMEIVLGRVCRGWREIVHSTPGMWTVITLSPVKSGRYSTEIHISRSASLPLSLRVELCVAEADFSEVWDLYLTIAERISQLSILYLEMGPSYLEFWQRSSRIPLPKLNTLIIPYTAPNVLFHFFEAIHAPKLQVVAISIFRNSPTHPSPSTYDHSPVDPLYLLYEELDPDTNFQVPVSVANIFPTVRDLGFIGVPPATGSQTLSAVIYRLARMFHNIVSFYTDISISTIHWTFSASRQLIWPQLHYVSFLKDIPTSANRALSIAMQESRAREGQPIDNVDLVGRRRPDILPQAALSSGRPAGQAVR